MARTYNKHKLNNFFQLQRKPKTREKRKQQQKQKIIIICFLLAH